MGEGRFSNLEVDEYRSPGEAAGGSGVSAAGEGRKHFVDEIRDAGYYIRQSERHMLDGDHEKALRAFAAALGENPLLLDAWVGQVRMLLELEEHPEAVLWADKAMEKFPDNPQLLATKSVGLYRMGRFREARGMNDVALQKEGEFEIVWLARGEILLAGDGAADSECFERAKRLSTRPAVTTMHIGGLYLRHGQHGQALGALREASRELPHSAWVWYQLGRAQAAVGDSEHARVAFGEAHKLNPANETYRNALSAPAKRRGGWLQRLFGRFVKP